MVVTAVAALRTRRAKSCNSPPIPHTPKSFPNLQSISPKSAHLNHDRQALAKPADFMRRDRARAELFVAVSGMSPVFNRRHVTGPYSKIPTPSPLQMNTFRPVVRH